MPVKTPALPRPNGLSIRVYKDDGKWDNYAKWFMRPMHQVRELAVADITLAHHEGEDEPCYSHEEWCDKAERLLREYPNCIFIYGSNC